MNDATAPLWYKININYDHVKLYILGALGDEEVLKGFMLLLSSFSLPSKRLQFLAAELHLQAALWNQ